MIITQKQKDQILAFFLEFKEIGKNGFSLSEQSFPGIKIYFNHKPVVMFANIMEIDGVQVYMGKDSDEEVPTPLEVYGNDPSEITL